MSSFTDIQIDTIADALVAQGYLVIDDSLPKAVLDALLDHCDHLGEQEFKVAGIGRQTDFQVQDSIRSDNIHWITTSATITTEFLVWMGSLRTGINRRLFMGLYDYESHFAHYPIGAFYKKHLDVFRTNSARGQSNRVISTVLYLNSSWQCEDGGELVLYAEDGEHILEKILPEFGRMVIFLSEKFPHEVLPATRLRKSIAGWFKDRS